MDSQEGLCTCKPDKPATNPPVNYYQTPPECHPYNNFRNLFYPVSSLQPQPHPLIPGNLQQPGHRNTVWLYVAQLVCENTGPPDPVDQGFL